MGYYYYPYYETYLQIEETIRETYFILDDAAKIVGTLITLLFCVAVFVVPLACAILNKKARVMGIITAILMPVSLVAAWCSLLWLSASSAEYGEMLLSYLRVAMEGYAVNPIQLIIDALWRMLIFTLWDILWGALRIFPYIFALIYAGRQFGTTKKAFSIISFCLLLLNTFFLLPQEYIFAGLFGMNQWVQIGWTFMYGVLTVFPFLLLLVQAIIVFVASRKEKRRAAIEAFSEEEAAQ